MDNEFSKNTLKIPIEKETNKNNKFVILKGVFELHCFIKGGIHPQISPIKIDFVWIGKLIKK